MISRERTFPPQPLPLMVNFCAVHAQDRNIKKRKAIARKLYYVLWMKHKTIIVFLCCAGRGKDVIALGAPCAGWMRQSSEKEKRSPPFNVKILSKPDYFRFGLPKCIQ